VIEFNHVSFSYGGENTINDVSFHINKGDFVALIGENGAGKTTIAKLCNGLLKPSNGSISVNGLDTRTTRTSRIARSVGFLFQNPDRQICQNTIRDEILFGLGFTVQDTSEREQRCTAILEEFGFDGSRNPFSMSRGERQRIALASLLACEPEVLILDEPTTGLDWRECMQIMELIQKRNTAGATVLMVCHDMELVQDFARRILVVTEGNLLGDGPTEEIMTNEPLLAQASVASAQIPALTMRFNGSFKNVFTAEDMAEAIERRCTQ
jgi:energy-coupling factor transport system ATP-binding protein